jgi:hypothetical protein
VQGENRRFSRLPFEKEAEFEAIDWEKFENWLRQTHTQRFSRDIVVYARRSLPYLQSGDLSEIGLMGHGKRARVIVIEFPVTIPPEKQIPNIEEKWLNNPTERSGIINWALEGLKRLLANKV